MNAFERIGIAAAEAIELNRRIATAAQLYRDAIDGDDSDLAKRLELAAIAWSGAVAQMRRVAELAGQPLICDGCASHGRDQHCTCWLDGLAK